MQMLREFGISSGDEHHQGHQYHHPAFVPFFARRRQPTTNNEQPVLVGQVHGGTTAIWLLA